MDKLSLAIKSLVEEIINLSNNNDFKKMGELQRASYKLFSYAKYLGVLKYINSDSSNYGMEIKGFEDEFEPFHESLILGNKKEFIEM